MSIASNPTTQFVLDQFDDAYEQKKVNLEKMASGILDEWPTERPTERYTYLESTPHMRVWRRGESREAKAFRAVSWTTDTFDFQVKTEWHRNDEKDHQGRRSISSKAQTSGNSAATMPIRLATQVIEAATDHELLPAIPTAPDGAAMFATTAGGAARFGATGGNLLTGTAATAAGIRTDYFLALQQFLTFQDTEGFPLWDPEILMAGVTVMYPIALMQVMAEAFQWARPFHGQAGTSTTDTSTGAATTNITQDFNVEVQAFPNSYLTDTSDWYIALNQSPVKPLYRGVHEALQSDIYDRSNSDRARDEKIHAVGWDARWSVGVGPMYQMIKINN